MRIIAILMRSAADPCSGELVAVRSPNARMLNECLRFGERDAELSRQRQRPLSVNRREIDGLRTRAHLTRHVGFGNTEDHGSATNARRISPPRRVRTGMFWRLGSDDDNRPVAAPVWLKLVCTRPVSALTYPGKAST